MRQPDSPLDFITGGSDSPSHFDHLDMRYRLRIRAYVGICMPPIFMSLNKHIRMMDLRKRGVASIMFYLDFTNGNVPVAFGRRITTEHTLGLYRSITDADNQPAREGTQRLMLVSNSRIMARERTHGHEMLGYDDGSGALVEAGTAEILHVLTRPVSAPGERQVAEVPQELGGLREHSWEKPLPSVDNLGEPPPGFELMDPGPWRERTDVWGLPNTDINQHVNVQEYITGAENQFSRVLHGAGLAVAKHHISRARLVFRKPFFPGQEYIVRSQLYRHDNLTQMQAGFHLLERGQPAERPSAFVVFDGGIDE